MKEEELFEPVKNLFLDMGYKVNAEIKGCDITATKDSELVIIELKKNLSVALLSQALDRQKVGAKVYVCVPKPKKYSPKNYQDTFYLLKKLELGLIFVDLKGEFSYAQIIKEPCEFFPPAKNYAKRKKIMKEIEGRTVDMNTGGVCGKKIATAYTEKCIHIACVLDCYGPLSVREMRKLGTDEKTSNIVRSNAYKWFKKIDSLTYEITKKGQREIMDYPELERYYTNLAKEAEN